MDKGQIIENRKYVIGGIILAVVVLYVIRLANLQLISDEYKTKADSNAYYRSVIYPSRGNIYDRNGELLVYNQPAFDIMVTMKEVKNLDTLEFCKALGITKETFIQRMADIKNPQKNGGYSSYAPQMFVGQLNEQEYSVIQEKLIRYPGFSFRKRNVRKYKYPYLAHVLGDVGEVGPADIEKDDYYGAGDFIGKQGVERSYEKELRGEKGVQILLRDARGKVHGHYKNGEEDVKPLPGKDVTLSIDIKLQALGERLMKGKRGAIVAIEPSTGEILCMVSSPTYDPRNLEGKERGNYINKLMKDKSNPLLNRAMMGNYPPGSTFKPTQALTFLQEGIINANTSYTCVRGFKYKGMKVGCHGHESPIALTNAIATSCNGYFCWGLYYMLSNKNKYQTIQRALNRWKDYMVKMGFGYKLGVDLPSESRGLIPNAQLYDKAYHNKWNPLSIISIAIGQGEVLATPVQIANLCATIANKGKYKTPHVVHSIQNGHVADSLTTFKYTSVKAGYYNYVIQGMRGAVLRGTCTGANIPGFDVCGKTGTAQNPHGRDHSAFMGFAPQDNPKIAVCVYVENGEWGATFGVPIGALMIEQYLRGELLDAGKSKASQFEHRTISYAPVKKNENTQAKKEEETNKKEETEETEKDENERISVFHRVETKEEREARERAEKIEEERRKAEEAKRAEEARRKTLEEQRKAEEQRKKEEEALRKAEIRRNAEIARRRAAEIRRKEEMDRQRRNRLQKQKQDRILNEAIQLRRTVNNMRRRIKRE